MKTYETVTEALEDLKKREYKLDFNLAFDQIICKSQNLCLLPGDFEIVETYRFEGDTSPDNEDIVYAIKSKDGKIKGTLTSAYGLYADSSSTEMLKKLSPQKK